MAQLHALDLVRGRGRPGDEATRLADDAGLRVLFRHPHVQDEAHAALFLLALLDDGPGGKGFALVDGQHLDVNLALAVPGLAEELDEDVNDVLEDDVALNQPALVTELLGVVAVHVLLPLLVPVPAESSAPLFGRKVIVHRSQC